VHVGHYAGAVGIIANCPGCPYSDGVAIGTRGDPLSPIVLVGEAPGANEIDEGRPFVGRAGVEVLWPAVAEAGLGEADFYVVNSVACRPFNPATPKVRKPSRSAIEACHDRFAADLGDARAVIVALGAVAVMALTNQSDFPVTKTKPGTTVSSRFGPVVPTLHPAYVLRRGLDGPERRRLVEDLRYARDLALRPAEQGK
jgi:DNA polymerase